MMRNVPGSTAARHLGTAALSGHEFEDATYLWPRAFSDLAEEYDARYGLSYDHLGRIAEINFANGRRNPAAQTRQWQFGPDSFTENDFPESGTQAALEPHVEQASLEGATGFVTAHPGQSCSVRYRSYSADDNTYQPYGGGPRVRCE